jgi:hypothetical protein
MREYGVIAQTPVSGNFRDKPTRQNRKDKKQDKQLLKIRIWKK